LVVVALDRCEHTRGSRRPSKWKWKRRRMVVVGEKEKEEKPIGGPVRAKWERARAAAFERQLMVVVE
jgi:hypothetical protein